jgi:hypothetical protein
MTRKISDHLHTTLAHEGKKNLPKNIIPEIKILKILKIK